MKTLIETIAKALVDHPDEVQVKEQDYGRMTVYHLCVHPADMGQVIGRYGKTAKAMRTVLSAATSVTDGERKRVRLEIDK